MTQDTIRIVEAILANPTDIAVVGALVAPEATYVSLNFENPDLKKIMPWCGTRLGPQAIVDTFTLVRRFWQTLSFEITDVFGSNDKGAVFGRFTYRSVKLGRETSSPFAVFARSANGKLTHMQFMEDTFATAASFRLRGTWTFASDPAGDEVTIGDEDQKRGDR